MSNLRSFVGRPMDGIAGELGVSESAAVTDGPANLNSNCTRAATDQFPQDLFSDDLRAQGAVILHVVASFYVFVTLGLICERYFVPAVEKICQALNMPKDIAGATFMAGATSSPGLFVNIIGTFVTRGNLGLSMIVGSAAFNILAVAACCGIGAATAGSCLRLKVWPLTRDCVTFAATMLVLIGVIGNGRVFWYEALIFVFLYLLYIALLYNDRRVWALLKRCGIQFSEDDEGNISQSGSTQSTIVEVIDEPKNEKPSESLIKSLGFPEKGCFRKLTWALILPVQIALRLTIPNCSSPNWAKWYPMTFVVSILWIGVLSYFVSWMISIIGDTMRIPESVMGLTLLAAGTSVPEAVTSVVVAKRGHGSMALSNCLGSNIFDVLLCLGLPWLFKASFLPSTQGQHSVTVNSPGFPFSVIILLSSVLIFYIALAWNRFKLNAQVGVLCLILYFLFITLAALIELNVFYQVNLPTCGW